MGKNDQIITLDGVRFALESDVSRSEASSRLVIVHEGGLEPSEFGEKLLNVGVGHAEIEVGYDQFSGASRGWSDATTTRSIVQIVRPIALSVSTIVRRARA